MTLNISLPLCWPWQFGTWAGWRGAYVLFTIRLIMECSWNIGDFHSLLAKKTVGHWKNGLMIKWQNCDDVWTQLEEAVVNVESFSFFGPSVSCMFEAEGRSGNIPHNSFQMSLYSHLSTLLCFSSFLKRLCLHYTVYRPLLLSPPPPLSPDP